LYDFEDISLDTKISWYVAHPQAGVAIGNRAAGGQRVTEYGASIQAVILCATLIFELVGPIVTKYSLIKAGTRLRSTQKGGKPLRPSAQ
jgi:hypothetical protein